jgi:phage-related protein
MPSRYRIAFYKREDDSCPVEDYLFDGKNITDLTVIINVIQRLAFVGQEILDTNMANRIDGAMCELRKGRHRIMYAEDQSIKGFIMLSAFLKETQKTPTEEIERARHNWEDYHEHHKVKEFEMPFDEELFNLI